jgi:hypothetical protein
MHAGNTRRTEYHGAHQVYKRSPHNIIFSNTHLHPSLDQKSLATPCDARMRRDFGERIRLHNIVTRSTTVRPTTIVAAPTTRSLWRRGLHLRFLKNLLRNPMDLARRSKKLRSQPPECMCRKSTSQQVNMDTKNPGQHYRSVRQRQDQEKVKEIRTSIYLGGLIPAASDIWSSRAGSGFTGIVIRWIDWRNWDLGQACVACRPFNGSHTAQRQAEKLDEMSKEIADVDKIGDWLGPMCFK